ncbi:aminoacyl-histidine dipeptidase [Pelomyxa schiedti]|nr:aminoacyl-histidine dipeptidase [Pelomyxa schiedti]
MATELQTERCRRLLEQLPEPKALWKWMLWCTEIPRTSGNTAQIRNKLAAVAKEWGLEYAIDAAKNIKIVKPASPGYESAPTVCLQAHQDIVGAHDPSVRPTYDMMTEPVWPIIKGEWLASEGTSLGADDGMGIATALAILENKTIPHPKIEFLCTEDEEVGTTGAQGLEASFLCPKTKYIINLDSEDKNALCLGSAGGANIAISIPIKREPIVDGVPLLVSVSGLSGGHSGVDIHLHRANAFKLVARMLLSAWDTGFSLAHLTGGSARNAIPRACDATVVVPAANVDKFKAEVIAVSKMLEMEYQTQEPTGIHLVIKPLDTAPIPLTRQHSRTIFNLWKLAPCHPMRMSAEISGLVETSMATTLVEWTEDSFKAIGLARTSRDSQWHEIEQHMQAITDLVGGSLSITGKYPGWLPVPTSRLAKVAQATHSTLFGKACRVYAIHAGLECGIFLEKLPNCEAISIGPEVKNPHSPSEICEIASGAELLHWVVAILKDLQN